MQTNATRDLLTKGSSSWQWDVTGGQSSLHLTSQIKMLNCNPSLKIFKTKCSLTDIKYTPLSDNKTSPVTREVATSPTENWQLSLFALPRVLTFFHQWGVAFDNLLDVLILGVVTWMRRHIFRGGCWSTTLGKNSIWSFFPKWWRNYLQHYHHQMIIHMWCRKINTGSDEQNVWQIDASTPPIFSNSATLVDQPPLSHFSDYLFVTPSLNFAAKVLSDSHNGNFSCA